MLGQINDRSHDRVSDRFGAVTCKSRPILLASLTSVTRHSGQMEQERKSRRAFHQSADRRAAEPQDEVAFPMTRDGARISFRWAFANHDFWRHERCSAP